MQSKSSSTCTVIPRMFAAIRSDMYLSSVMDLLHHVLPTVPEESAVLDHVELFVHAITGGSSTFPLGISATMLHVRI